MADKYNYIRKDICDIISRMLNNPDKHGIYPTSMCYAELEAYIKGIIACLKD